MSIEPTPRKDFTEFDSTELEKRLNALTSRQLAAQCVMIRISDEDYYASEERRTYFRKLIRDEGIGGVCVFQGEAVQTAMMIAELQKIASSSALQMPIPLLVAGDFEHGVAMRLAGGTAFPHAMNLAMGNDETQTFRVAQSIARESFMLGVHWNFAPVCDVNSNKLNPVIGNRGFGEDADCAARHASQYVRGTQSVGVMACAKHFPGHGDTSVDSHHALPVLPFDKTRLDALELKPFRAAIAAGVRSVMIGHLALPALHEKRDSALPASLSPRVVRTLLREELGFDGIVITDGLDMNAITSRYANLHEASAQSAVEAMRAGVDVILLPPDPRAALDGLERAINEGVLSLEDVRSSARRVLEAKQWCGVLGASTATSAVATMTAEDTKKHQITALEAAKKGLRWFDGDGRRSDALPLRKFRQVAGFGLVDGTSDQANNNKANNDRANEAQIDAATHFFRYLAQNFQGDCDFGFVDEHIQEDDVFALMDGTRDAEAFVFAVFARPITKDSDGVGAVRLPEGLLATARRLTRDKPSIVVLFGNSHVRDTFPATVHLCAFSSSEPALGAAAHALVQDF